MKIPKVQKKYCPYCKKHTEHKVIIVKVKARPKTKKGALKAGVRRYAELISGYGSTVRPVIAPVKTVRKANLKFECPVCKKQHYKQNPIHMKKLEQN